MTSWERAPAQRKLLQDSQSLSYPLGSLTSDPGVSRGVVLEDRLLEASDYLRLNGQRERPWCVLVLEGKGGDFPLFLVVSKQLDSRFLVSFQVSFPTWNFFPEGQDFVLLGRMMIYKKNLVVRAAKYWSCAVM